MRAYLLSLMETFVFIVLKIFLATSISFQSGDAFNSIACGQKYKMDYNSILLIYFFSIFAGSI